MISGFSPDPNRTYGFHHIRLSIESISIFSRLESFAPLPLRSFNTTTTPPPRWFDSTLPTFRCIYHESTLGASCSLFALINSCKIDRIFITATDYSSQQTKRHRIFVFLTIADRLPHYQQRDFTGFLTKSSRIMPAGGSEETLPDVTPSFGFSIQQLSLPTAVNFLGLSLLPGVRYIQGLRASNYSIPQ